MKVYLQHLATISLIAIICGCTTTMVGVGTGPAQKAMPDTGAPKKVGVEALQISFQEALELAREAAQLAFPGARVVMSIDEVSVYNASFWRGDVKASVEPKLVRDLDDDKRQGIIYEITASGVGANASLGPGYVSRGILDEISQLRSRRGITSLVIKHHEVILDKAIPEFIAASIPTTYAGFAQYLDNKPTRGKYEGIWATLDNRYTLGIVYVSDDPRYEYHAFILESSARNWKPGEIKAKFTELAVGRVTLSQYRMANKAEVGITWQIDENLMTSLNAPLDKQIALVRIGKSDESVVAAKSGTAWAVSENGIFVTNAHVIADAKRIHLGFQGGQRWQTRTLALDSRLDLAIVQTVNPIHVTPIPLSNRVSLSNGSDVTVIGYPLTPVLGETPRVTRGIISAQAGLNNDVSRYQVSAAIQPGSSGGPIIADDGTVCAVAVSKLIGPAVESVNFGIKVEYLRVLLQQLGLNRSPTPRGIRKLSSSEIFELYKDSVFPIWVE